MVRSGLGHRAPKVKDTVSEKARRGQKDYSTENKGRVGEDEVWRRKKLTLLTSVSNLNILLVIIQSHRSILKPQHDKL